MKGRLGRPALATRRYGMTRRFAGAASCSASASTSASASSRMSSSVMSASTGSSPVAFARVPRCSRARSGRTRRADAMRSRPTALEERSASRRAASPSSVVSASSASWRRARATLPSARRPRGRERRWSRASSRRRAAQLELLGTRDEPVDRRAGSRERGIVGRGASRCAPPRAPDRRARASSWDT